MFVSNTRVNTLRNFDVTVSEEFNHGLSLSYQQQAPGEYAEMLEDPKLNAYVKAGIKVANTEITPIRFFIPARSYAVLAMIDGEQMHDDSSGGRKILNVGGRKESQLQIQREQHVLIVDESGRIQKVAVMFVKVSHIEGIDDGDKKNKS